MKELEIGIQVTEVETGTNEVLEANEIEEVKNKFVTDMIEVAPDLGTNDLARDFADSLFKKITKEGVQSIEEIERAGEVEFYNVGKDTLGPLAVSFVDSVLMNCGGGSVVFPARDATPFFAIAQTLIEIAPDRYPAGVKTSNPVFNRKTWGVDDEQDSEDPVTEITDPIVQKLLAQMGFDSDEPVTFVEVGAWGSMVDGLKTAMHKGLMKEKPFSVYFLFTHMPEYIYGFINSHNQQVSHKSLEAIADSFEGLPKYFKRPTELFEEDGEVKASLEGKIIDSPFLQAWSDAVKAGFIAAAKEYITSLEPANVQTEIQRLQHLARAATQGYFNGMLPRHTETWSEGALWRQNWKWGKTLPLKEEIDNVS